MTLDLFFEIAGIFEKNGFSLFLVGGSVRDYLLYGHFDDMDLVTNANLYQMQQFLIFKSTYPKFNSGKFIYKNKEIDVTTLRKEDEYNDFRHPKRIITVNSPKEEYKRRDFTINALYMDKEGKILDYCFGQKDLNEGIIKMIGDPSRRFKEDPLRILRALRFSFILNFKLDQAIVEAIKNYKYLLKHLNYLKIIEELSKFKSKPAAVRKFLAKYEIDKEISLFYENNKKEYLNLWNEKAFNTIEFDIIKEFSKMQKKSLLGQVFIFNVSNDFQQTKLRIINYLDMIKQNYNFIENVVNYHELSSAFSKEKRISILAVKDNGFLKNYEELISLGISVIILQDDFFKAKNIKERILTLNRLNLIIDISLLSLEYALEVMHISSKRVTILNFNYFKTKNAIDQNILNQLIINKVLIGCNNVSIDYPNSLLAYSFDNKLKEEKEIISKKIAYLNFFDFIKSSN